MSEPNRILAPTLLPVFRIWVIGIVVFVAVSPTDITPMYRLYLALAYTFLFFLPVMSARYSRISSSALVDYDAIKFRWVAILLAVQFFAIETATQFYTGSSLLAAFRATLAGRNIYGDYQSYFADAQIAYAPIMTRLTYIFLLALGKVIFVFSVVNFFVGTRYRISGFIFMVCGCVVYLGFGIARGTFFEVFEVACGIFYFWYMASTALRESRVQRRKTVLIVAGIMGVILVGLFVLNAMRRFENATLFFHGCSQNFCYESYGINDFIEHPLYLLTVYFGNGGYFIAALLDATLKYGETAYLLPFQSIVFNWGSDEFGIRSFMCGRYAQCRFVWTPEVATIISIFGILAIPITNILLVSFGRLENWVIHNFSVPGMLLLYFLFVLAISLPSANFFTISTPSIISTAVLIGLVLWRRGIQPRREIYAQ